MNKNPSDLLVHYLTEIASQIENNEEPAQAHFQLFTEEPDLALALIDHLQVMREEEVDERSAYYSACLFALDVCIAQLQSAVEHGSKLGRKFLDQLMARIALAIREGDQSLGFWLPVLNGFYDAHVELSDVLEHAYFDLASTEDQPVEESETTHLESMRSLILDLGELSPFEIAEHFFAQSYAMPPDFFMDFVADLAQIEEGRDIVPLMLLHPKQDVRDAVVSTIDYLMSTITFSSATLTRLQVIKNWYPPAYHEQFERWIKAQRKKEVVFLRTKETLFKLKHLYATEIDGGGAQGVFIHLSRRRKSRLCGLLLKQTVGIKDAWITPTIPESEVEHYYEEAFDDTVMLRPVDQNYWMLMMQHFLAQTIQRGEVPGIHLLEIQEATGFHMVPEAIDMETQIQQLAVQINPFTPEAMRLSLRRSKTWPNHKRFTESWYIENEVIDKIVNEHCSFVQSVKVCDLHVAREQVLTQVFESQRDMWCFHFLWVALWLKAKSRKNEKAWQDSFFVAYAIQTGVPLKDIPIIWEICHQSVINSMETMQERRTYLH